MDESIVIPAAQISEQVNKYILATDSAERLTTEVMDHIEEILDNQPNHSSNGR